MNDLATTEKPHPLVLIQQAIEKGMTSGDMVALAEMQRRYDADRAREAFAQAMADCQKEMPVMVRDTQNRQTNSEYVQLDQIMIRCKPIWLKHGFTLSFTDADGAREGLKRTACTVRHIGGHVEHHFLDLPPDDVGLKGAANKTLVHAIISSGTYAQRILTVQIFDISIAGKDLDGNTIITPKQLAELEDLITKSGTDRLKFLQWFGIQLLDELPTRRFKDAVAYLERKLQGK